MIALYIFGIVVAIVVIFITIKSLQMIKGRKIANNEIKEFKHGKIENLGEVEKLSLTPLVEMKADDTQFKTEPGVSYLIQADKTNILMDVGLNSKKEHPSPLLHNSEKIGFSLKDLDMIYFSHLHLDHLGGMAEQKNREFSFSKGLVETPSIPVYSPEPLKPSKYNPNFEIHSGKEPSVIQNGIVNMGVIPRYLFMMGYTAEQNLAINIKDKGLALIIGCGHQRIERVIERAKQLFDIPIYAIIGGLHFPIKGGRIMVGPLNLQYMVGSDTVPWFGLKESDINIAIKAIKDVNPQIVSLSAHDSSDWAIDKFKNAFGDKYIDLKIGEKIVL